MSGHPAKPHRHRQNLRPKCDPQEEREPQPPTISLTNRCRILTSTDSRHHATSDWQYGECGQGHGQCDEEHEPRAGRLRPESDSGHYRSARLTTG